MTQNGIKYAAKQLERYPPRYNTMKGEIDPHNEDKQYAEAQRNFLHECHLHSKLRHPNIVKMIGVVGVMMLK